MPVITLTSDMGLNDHYVAAVKGGLLRACPGVNLVDISHGIKPHALRQAAYILRSAWPHFPPGTVHWTGISAANNGKIRRLAAFHEGHWFLARDEGLFSLVFEGYPQRIFSLDDDAIARIQSPGSEEATTGLPPEACPHHRLTAAAAHLASGRPIESIADEIRHLEARGALAAQERADDIRGMVLYVDRFGNAVVNIHRDRFEVVGGGRPFELHVRRDRIDRLSTRFTDVPAGEKLCRFNGAGYLEIAINQGNASALLGLAVDDVIQVTFG